MLASTDRIPTEQGGVGVGLVGLSVDGPGLNGDKAKIGYSAGINDGKVLFVQRR